jgi:hypothetical protein
MISTSIGTGSMAISVSEQHMAVDPGLGVRFHGYKPAPADQDFGRFERGLPILPDRAWTVTVDIARANGGLIPVVLQPVE